MILIVGVVLSWLPSQNSAAMQAKADAIKFL
jgi:hypothetical protein